MSKKRVVAKVDGNEIYYWQYYDALISFANEVLKKPVEQLSGAEYESCSNEALNKVIAGELFYLDASEAGVTATDEDVATALKEFIKFCQPENYPAFLSDRDITEEEFREYIRKQLVRERYVNALLKRIPEPSKEELNAFYEKVKDRLTLPPQFSFVVAYLETTDGEQKERFKAALSGVANRKMAPSLAEKILNDLKESIGGLNVVIFDNKSSEDMSVQVKNLLSSIEDEHFSSIFDAPDEVSIFYMKKKADNIPMTEDECRKEAERYFKIARLKNILDAYVESLKEKRNIEVLL